MQQSRLPASVTRTDARAAEASRNWARVNPPLRARVEPPRARAPIGPAGAVVDPSPIRIGAATARRANPFSARKQPRTGSRTARF